jgi:hypothetical protein
MGERVTAEEVLQDKEVAQEVGLEIPNESPQQEEPSESPQQEEPQVNLPSDEEPLDIPEKFQGKSPEEIIKAYLELEKKLGNPQEEPQEEAPSEEKPEKTPEELAKYEKYLDKVKSGEGLTEEDYSELEALGYTRDFINEQVEFIQYKAQQYVREVLDPVGGEEVFKEAVAWAKENWPEDKIKEYNETIAKVPKLAQQALVKELVDAYKAGATTEPIHSNTPPAGSKKGYTSETDFMKDISDPRYGKDPAYTKAVEAKMAQTDTTGWVGFSAHIGE